jgi:hypothetical protein
MKYYDPEKLHVTVSSADGTLLIDGTMPLNQNALVYPFSSSVIEDNIGIWNYNLLDLKTGYDNKLNIYYTGNKPEGETVFNGDLIAMILLAAQDGKVNLDCDNDYTVKVLIKDYCVECWTHFSLFHLCERLACTQLLNRIGIIRCPERENESWHYEKKKIQYSMERNYPDYRLILGDDRLCL